MNQKIDYTWKVIYKRKKYGYSESAVLDSGSWVGSKASLIAMLKNRWSDTASIGFVIKRKKTVDF